MGPICNDCGDTMARCACSAEERLARRDAAWARLVRAARGVGSTADNPCGTAAAWWEEEYVAAKQALRDLGVDVDALLAD